MEKKIENQKIPTARKKMQSMRVYHFKENERKKMHSWRATLQTPSLSRLTIQRFPRHFLLFLLLTNCLPSFQPINHREGR